MQTSETKKNQILRMKGVTELVCLSKSSLYDKMNPKSKRYDSSFPRPMMCNGVL